MGRISPNDEKRVAESQGGSDQGPVFTLRSAARDLQPGSLRRQAIYGHNPSGLRGDPGYRSYPGSGGRQEQAGRGGRDLQPDIVSGSPHRGRDRGCEIPRKNAGTLGLAMTDPHHLSNDLKLAMYRRMVLCRRFEERVYYMFLQGTLPGTIHQSQGQEACAVGVCSALQEKDVITSTHRPHSHAIARGVSVNSLMAELFAKKTGCCRAKGGSMHVGDPESGMLPAIAIVGGGIPIAAGCALAFQYLKRPRIAACFFAEGATNIGTFHEALNMAAIWNLPVVFVCENNKYAASTAVSKGAEGARGPAPRAPPWKARPSRNRHNGQPGYSDAGRPPAP